MTRHEWTSPNLAPLHEPRPPRPPRPKNTNTPGLGGYVLAVALACGFAGSWIYAGLVIEAVVENGTPHDLVSAAMAGMFYAPFVALAAATYGLPVGVAGVLVVHLSLRRVADQRIHVFLAGVVGAVFAACYLRLTGAEDDYNPVLVALSVGVAAAASRVAVLPLVESRRRLAAQGRLTGTARW